VEHLHQELKSPCGAVMLQLDSLNGGIISHPPLFKMLNVFTQTLLHVHGIQSCSRRASVGGIC
jgi:hypothetical protein